MAADKHQALLQRVLDDVLAEPFVAGVMVRGSVARGDHYPGSDLDLLVLLEKGRPSKFASSLRESILVERHYSDLDSLKRKLAERPMLAYGVTDGRILHDPAGMLTEVVDFAKTLLAGYTTPAQALQGIRYWLYAARIKLEAARAAGDELKVGFLASTNTWKILEGLWAAHDLPMPPSGAVLVHLRDLTRGPEDMDARIKELLMAIWDSA